MNWKSERDRPGRRRAPSTVTSVARRREAPQDSHLAERTARTARTAATARRAKRLMHLSARPAGEDQGQSYHRTRAILPAIGPGAGTAVAIGVFVVVFVGGWIVVL
ncbi:hypothetical protein PSP6_710041 [Paraburkholderia tropica]|nr:hypothetical protein PSP6_710041 [Paraburkholderia tropica]